MNIELTEDQAAAFEAGEPITIVKPKPEPVRETFLVFDSKSGSVALVRKKDGRTCKYILLRATGGNATGNREWSSIYESAFDSARFTWVRLDV